MVQGDNEGFSATGDVKSDDSLYNRFSGITPFRDDVDESGGKVEEYGDSLDESMKRSPRMTDTQIVDKRLFPSVLFHLKGETIEWLQNIMVSRVFPETLNPLRNIIVKHLLQEYEDMSFAEAICIAELVLTVALDGEGRMDIIHMFSKLSGESEEDKKSRLV